MKRLALLLMAGWLSCGHALAQTTPFSTYITGLPAASSLVGTERMFALQTGASKTATPYQILSLISGDCSVASPPSVICTKTNGVAFATSATVNTTNAANITSGTLPQARLPYLATSATTDTTNASNISSGTLGLPRLALTSAFYYVGNVSNNPAGVAMSGDCTLANTGAVTCTKTSGTNFGPFATQAAPCTIAQGCTGQTTKQPAMNALAPTPTRAGDIMYYDGANWVSFAGNNTSTRVLSENASGVPAWAAAGAGTVFSVTCGTGLSGGTFTGSGTCALALTSATVQASPADPTGTTSGVGVMMGLGGTCKLTPVYSTRIQLSFQGYGSNTTNNGVQMHARFGTGTAPANGAAATGTQVGSAPTALSTAGSINAPFNVGGIITGLSPGTAYWFDLGVAAVTGGTASTLSISCSAMEF